mgnify:FL=1
MSTTSAKRARAAERNMVRDLAKVLNEDLYETVSPEMKDAFISFGEVGSVIACACGNKNQTKWFVGCAQHLVCEICAEDSSKVCDRRGRCVVPGCSMHAAFPPTELHAMAAVAYHHRDATIELRRALEIEAAKDGEGEKRRKEALGKRKGREQTPEQKAEAAAKRRATMLAKKAAALELLELRDEVEELREKVGSFEEEKHDLEEQLRGVREKLEHTRAKKLAANDRVRCLAKYLNDKGMTDEQIADLLTPAIH